MQIINHYIIAVVGGKYIAYKGGSLYVSADLKRFEFLCKIPMPAKRRLLSEFSLTSRLLRLYPRAVCVIDEQSFIFGYYGSVFHVSVADGIITREHVFPAPMKTPVSFTKVEGVKGFDNCILYGEYHANPEKRDMSVYARKDGVWVRVFSFKASEILHIHGFCVDKKHDRVLILTGDKDEESGIFAAKNNFKEVEPIVKGSQSFRSCVAFADDSIVYATDTPLAPNYIYKITDTNTVERLFEMPGPSIFGCRIEKEGRVKCVFSTSVEPDSRIRGKRYFFTYKLGEGVKSRYCHLILGDEKNGFKEIAKYKKDWLPITAFQFGNASFCEGNEKLIITPQSLKRLNNKSIVYGFDDVL